MWHVETDIFAFIIMGILYVKNRKLKVARTEQDYIIGWMLLVSMGLTLIDLISSIVMNGYGGYMLYLVVTTLYYATATILACVWLIYVYMQVDGGHLHMTPLRWIAAVVPQVIITLVALSSPWTGAVFTVTKDMVYSRGPLFMSFTLLYEIYYPAVGLLTIAVYHKRIQPQSSVVPMVLFFLIIPVATMLQLRFPGTLLICLAFAVIFIVDDLTIETERRNMLYAQLENQNEKLAAAVKMAEHANNAKSEFLSRMSHDIRTPMNAIIGFATLQLQNSDDEDKVRDQAGKILTSGSHLLGVINDVLDMSKIETGQFEMTERVFKLDDTIATIESIMRPQTNQRRQTFTIDKGEVEHEAFVGDEQRLQQVLLNILSNATKYTDQGGTITMRITARPSKHAKYEVVTFEVEDNGRGMSEEYQKVIFEAFSREQLANQEVAQGTGLGMAITKNLVTMMGGSISVKSELGTGSTFTVILPLMIADETQREEHRALKESLVDISGMHLLAAEDNELNAEILVDLLDVNGVTVDVEVNGLKCANAFRAAPVGTYDAILMDIQMPVMDGYHATRAIRSLETDADLSEDKRQEAATIPIIAMTANAFTDDVEHALSVGMNAHIAKPLDFEAMKKTIADQVHKQKQS